MMVKGMREAQVGDEVQVEYVVLDANLADFIVNRPPYKGARILAKVIGRTHDEYGHEQVILDLMNGGGRATIFLFEVTPVDEVLK